jgi:hypothetical protein
MISRRVMQSTSTKIRSLIGGYKMRDSVVLLAVMSLVNEYFLSKIDDAKPRQR